MQTVRLTTMAESTSPQTKRAHMTLKKSLKSEWRRFQCDDDRNQPACLGFHRTRVCKPWRLYPCKFFIRIPRVFTSLDRSNDGGVPILSSGKRMSDNHPYGTFPHFHSPSLHQICSTVSDPRRLSPHIENVA